MAHVAVQAGDSIETIMATYIKEWRKAAHAEATRANFEEAMARVVG